MKFAVILLACFILMIPSDAQRRYQPYSCQRINSPCVSNNGGQCLADGACRCTITGFQGFNCGLQTSRILTPQQCSRNCENGGICYSDGTAVSRCFCPPAYYGATCRLPRVAILGCDETQMTVLVNPHQSNLFNGRIYVRYLSGVAACNINLTASPPYEGFVRTLSLNRDGTNPCLDGMEVIDNALVKRYTVIVQYYERLLSWPDEIYTFQCSQTASGSFIGFILNGLDFNPQTDGLLTGVDVSAGHVPLNIRITRQPNRTPLGTNIHRVGDDVFLEVEINAGSSFSTLRIDSVVGYDRNINPTTSQAVIVNGCPVSTQQGITVSFPQRPNPDVVLVPFKLFKFMDSESLYLRVSTTLCIPTEAGNCNPFNCSDSSNGFGRRKRQADESTERANATTHIFVITPGDTTVAQVSCPADSVRKSEYPSCFQNSTFLIVVVLFAVLLISALVMLGLFCFRLRQSQHKSNKDHLRNSAMN